MGRDDAYRAGLLLAYFNGEARSAAVLGDYLEERGEPRVKAYGDVVGRMQVVLSNLPEDLAHQLAGDFAERALPAFEADFPGETAPRQAVRAKRGWLLGAVDDDELVECRKQAFRRAERFRREDLGSHVPRSRRPALLPYWSIMRPRNYEADRVCQSAGHAASFAVHTTALYAARFAILGPHPEDIEHERLVQVDLLETALVSYAYAAVY